MFIELDNEWQRWWLVGLLLLWAGLLFGGFIFGTMGALKTRRMPTWTRLFSSLVLVVASWSWYGFTHDGTISGFSLLMALGMTLGCLGDFFMAEMLPVPQPVLGGISAFGLGHVAYISALVQFGNQHNLTDPTSRWGSWFVWLLIGVVGWYFVVFRGQSPTVLHWAALPYALLLASTAGFATGLALQASPFISVAIGAGLFLLSDLILAAQLFNHRHFYLIGDVIWLTYGPGQMLLVYATGSTLQFLGNK
jgi:hypothetical protein